MVSHEHRCIFIHIPKCAGTSIETALGHFDGHEGRGGQDHRTIRMIERPFPTLHVLRSPDNLAEALRRLRRGRTTVLNPRSNEPVTREQYDSYYKFTFVRNPWARAYSWYRNVLRDDHHRRSHHLDADVPLGAFLERHLGRGMLRPQLAWLRDFRGRLPLDFVGRFENLAADFRLACEAMGVDAPELPHKTQGGGGDYREHYDADTRALVARAYREEIALFGYTFEA